MTKSLSNTQSLQYIGKGVHIFLVIECIPLKIFIKIDTNFNSNFNNRQGNHLYFQIHTTELSVTGCDHAAFLARYVS